MSLIPFLEGKAPVNPPPNKVTLPAGELQELLRTWDLVNAETAKRGPLQPDLKYSPHKPHPGPQTRFLSLNNREAFYGGAAGGGKSDALLMAALQYVHVPGYSALLLRRSYADLKKPEALLDRAWQWLGPTDAKPVDGGLSWRFPSGARLDFGYLQNRGDENQYQGAAYQFVGFDELTQFEEYQYRYLFSRTRRLEGSSLPVRTRGAANPGGVGHEWVKRRFLIEGESKGRIYVPAKLTDNPSLDAKDYTEALMELDPVTRAQLLNGSWDVVPDGPIFKREWFKVTREKPIPQGLRLVRYWDLAATEAIPGKDPDWTRGALIAIDVNGQWWILDMQGTRSTPLGVEQLIKSTAARDGINVPICMEQEPGSSGKTVIDHYQRTVLVGYAVFADKKTGDKKSLAGPLASAAEAGNVYMLEGIWNGDALDEFTSFPLEGFHDDQVDTCSGGMRWLTDGNLGYGDIPELKGTSRYSPKEEEDDRWDDDPEISASTHRRL